MNTALIDVDGVLAACTPHTLSSVGGRVKPSEIVTWELRDYMNEDEKAAVGRLWHDADWWLTIPVIAGAREGIEQLRDLGYEIIAITAPFHTCKGWENARRAWLEEHFDISPDHVMIVPGKRKARVHGDIFIDDKLETILDWSQRWSSAVNAHEHAFLFDAPYNQTNNRERLGHGRWSRLAHWLDVPVHVGHRAFAKESMR